MEEEGVLALRESIFTVQLVCLSIAAQKIMEVHGGPTKYGKSNLAGYKSDHLTKLGLSQECKGSFTENLCIKFATLIG